VRLTRLAGGRHWPDSGVSPADSSEVWPFGLRCEVGKLLGPVQYTVAVDFTVPGTRSVCHSTTGVHAMHELSSICGPPLSIHYGPDIILHSIHLSAILRTAYSRAALVRSIN
jgi:hypothetical protein